MRKGIISVIFCIIAVFSLAVTANAELDANKKAWLEKTHYGYGLLDDANEKLAYEAIYEGVDKEQKIIPFEVSWGIKKDQFDKVYQYYLHDSPEHYWLWGDGLSFKFDSEFQGDYVKTITLTYNGSKTSMALDFEKGVTSLIGDLMGNTILSDKEKALIVHDRLADWVEYDNSVNYSAGKQYIHRAYGAITRHLAVCDGYAYAYQLLLNRLGIMAVTVSGYGATNSGYGSHAWNLVEFTKGNWSYVDVTWDDQTDNIGIYHYYFGIDAEIIAGTSTSSEVFDERTDAHKLMSAFNESRIKNHYIVYKEENKEGKAVTNIPFELPTNIVNNNCFDTNHTLSEFNVDKIASIMEIEGEKAVADFLYTGTEDFDTWLKEKENEGENANVVKVATKKGIFIYITDSDGYIQYTLRKVGKEIRLEIKLFNYSPTHVCSGGTATCHSRAVCSVCHQAYGDYADHKIIEYCPFEAPSTKTAENKHEGTREHWICSECGSTFIERKYNGETVYDEVRFEDLVVEPYTPGDVNGDGNVNNRDVIALFRFLSGEEVYGISLGACNPKLDYDGNGAYIYKRNNKDIIYLFKYVSRVKNIELH